MREVNLVKKFNRTYKALGLKYKKIVVALVLMFLTSILEMSGLSILYPLVLAMGGENLTASLPIPVSIPFALSQRGQILLLFSCVALLYVAKNIALYFTYQNNINFAVYFYKNLVRGLYSAHIHRPLLDFQKESAGSLAHIICVQSEKLVDGALRPSLVVITELFLLVGISALVFFINPLLMIAVLFACGGAEALYYFLFRNSSHGWGKQYMAVATSQQDLVNSTSVGISEIKVFGKERFLISKLWNITEEKTKMFHHLEMFQQGPRFIAETVFIITVMLFFSVQLIGGASPSILIAQFSVVAAASFRILPSINRIVGSYSNFSFNLGPALQLLDSILDSALLKRPLKTSSEQPSPVFATKHIRMDSISFKYPLAPRPVLENVSLELPCGQRIGLIGDSGSGKSTLIKLLAGLYTPSSGTVLVDGNDISGKLRTWQSSLGYVPQESFIMPGTIRENILFGGDASIHDHRDERVWEVLRTVGLADFVSELPEKLNTRIGEKGVAPSGGQKQLVCMARALFRNPRVLLLDEPTASLDGHNEQIVLRAIHELPPDTFIVMASHKHQNFQGFHIIYTYDSNKRTFRETRNRCSERETETSPALI